MAVEGKDDHGPLLMLARNDTMEARGWGTDELFAEVRTDQGDGQVREEPRHRGQVLAFLSG